MHGHDRVDGLFDAPFRTLRATSSGPSASSSSGETGATGCRSTCRNCEVRFACHGGCPKNRFRNTPDGEPGLNYLCAGYKHFFHHIDEPMKAMCDLLNQGRAPADFPQLLAEREAARFADVGRNDPCPCGSGAKYKKCHGAADDSVPIG